MDVGSAFAKPADGANSGIRKTAEGKIGSLATTQAIVATAKPVNDAYKIGVLDELEISVFKVKELSKTLQVASTGTINFPLVGQIEAAGKTAQAIEQDLEKKLGAKYLQNPQVTVYVKEYNSQRVTVQGAVRKPGVYPIIGKTSLLQTVAQAQGLNANSDSTVLILRTTNGKRSAAKFDLAAISAGTSADPSIRSGDVIVAGTSAIKKTFNNILKAVPIAGAFALL